MLDCYTMLLSIHLDLHLILPALNLFILDAGILLTDNGATSKIDDVLIEHGGLLHVLPLIVHLKF